MYNSAELFSREKELYKRFFKLTYSDCYEKYGMERTGCPACPFSKSFDDELIIIDKNEPKLSKAVNSIFSEAFEYQRAYYKFRDEMIEKEQQETLAKLREKAKNL